MDDVRVGTRERELAMGALDEHHRAGRLDAGEYHERSAAAAGARMRSELDGLFADLPAPHPRYPDRGPSPSQSSSSETESELGPTSSSPSSSPSSSEPAGPADLPELVAPLGATLGRHAGVLSALAPVAVFALVALTGFRFPQLFLLVPVIIAVLAWLGHRHGPR